MPLQKALIVDDSRTAAALLGKMLSRLGLVWDQVDSGEECLAYLQSSVPDVVFMDHMMPGMDGFQAVKAILTRSELGFLPIVMHTSRQGVVYYGQARALGAVGVLQKPATQQDLVRILERVSAAIAEHRVAKLESDPLDSSTRVSTCAAPLTVTVMQGGELRVGNGSPPVLPAASARLSLVGPESVDDFSSAVSDASPAVSKPASIPPLLHSTPALEPNHTAVAVTGRFRWGHYFAAVLLIAGLMISLYWRSAPLAADHRQSLLSALAVLINQHAEYPQGEIPFDSERLVQLRQVVAILSSAGVVADIELRAHVGEYCRVLVPGVGAALPAGDVPIEACDLIGYEPAEARRMAALQVSEFSDYVARVNALDNGLSISVVPLGTAEPLLEYPPASGITRVSEWNRIAARNQRIETRILEPAAER